MSAFVKHWLSVPVIILIFMGVYWGCGDNPVDEQSEYQLADIENIIWTLDSFNKPGTDLPVSQFPPFYLIYTDSSFFGDDGCNIFGGFIEVRDDSIFPSRVSQTLRLCIRATFPIDHLTTSYRLRIEKNKLRIFSDDDTYTYKSDVTASVANNPLLQNWILTDSTDPEFADIQMQQLTPTLSFDENRYFKIEWYCVPENTFGCDEISGIFGIGEPDKIVFYETAWQDHGRGLAFINRILNASSYSLMTNPGAQDPPSRKSAKLVLFNQSEETRYEFEAVIRNE